MYWLEAAEVKDCSPLALSRLHSELIGGVLQQLGELDLLLSVAVDVVDALDVLHLVVPAGRIDEFPDKISFRGGATEALLHRLSIDSHSQNSIKRSFSISLNVAAVSLAIW